MAGEGDAERLVVLLEARIRDFEKNMEKASGTATRAFNKARDDAKKASRAMEDEWNKAAGGVARAMAALGGPLGQAAARFAAFNEAGSKTGVILGGAAAGISVLVAASLKAVTAYAALESAAARATNAIRLTGSASREAFDRSTTGLAATGLNNLNDIRAAQIELLKFRGLSSSVFEEAMRQAQALASTGFVTLQQAATAFGRALQNPTEGINGLREAGLRITPVQEKLIEQLFKSGRAVEAQNELLRIAEGQLGGNTARAADTLSAAFGRLVNTTQTTIEKWGEAGTEGRGLIGTLDQITARIAKIQTAKPTDWAAVLGVPEWLVKVATYEVPIPKWMSGQLPVPPMSGNAEGPARGDAGAFERSTKAARDYGIELDRLIARRARLQDRFEFASNASRDPFDAHAIEARTLTREIEKVDAAIEKLNGRGRITVTRASGLTDQQRDAIQATNIALERQTQLMGMNEGEREKFEARSRAMISTEGDVSEAVRRAADAINQRVNAMLAAGAMRQFTDQMDAQTSALRIEIATMGMAVGAATAYRIEQEKLAELARRGIVLDAKQTEELQARAKAMGELTQQAALARVEQQIKFDRDTMFMSEKDMAIARQLVPIYGSVADAMASMQAQQMRFINSMKELHGYSLDFAQTLVQGLMSGKSLMDSLAGAAQKLSQTLANDALKDLWQGNFISAAVKGVGALITGLFAGDAEAQKELEEAKKRWAEMADEVREFRHTTNGPPLTGLIAELRARAAQEKETERRVEDDRVERRHAA